MDRWLQWCTLVLALGSAVLAEPPVPQGLYGAPGATGSRGRSPSPQYGAPGASGAFGASGAGGYPGANGGFRDPRDNPMFSHEQDFQRPQGEIWGKWTVALPDGRVQKVEYDADATGFHPVITYEEPASGNGGSGAGFGSGSGGSGAGFGRGGGGQGGYRYR